jgi:hypothetical protein
VAESAVDFQQPEASVDSPFQGFELLVGPVESSFAAVVASFEKKAKN